MSKWQQELAEGFSSSHELLAHLGLSPAEACHQAEHLFKTKVPREFVSRMERRLDDPLLRQVLASALEQQPVLGYEQDPLQEKSYNPLAGLVHKYHNRVLLIAAGACAIHCRYCFRRHFDYSANTPGKKAWLEVQAYLKAHQEIDEVILSGGDPLILNNAYFEYLMDLLKDVGHIKVLRIHSRIPIVLPSRIEAKWLDLMDNYPFAKIMVTHVNHPHELNHAVQHAIDDLKRHNWTLLNQTVLLKTINDDPLILETLSKRLFDYGILPYYLHVLDKVQGVAHFDLTEHEIRTVYQALQERLSGYLLPRLVVEVPGKRHKTIWPG